MIFHRTVQDAGPELQARIVDEIKTVVLDWSIGNKQSPSTLAVLCCFSVVIVQQSAQPLAALHRSRYFMSCLDWPDQRRPRRQLGFPQSHRLRFCSTRKA
jgi:hypothetical protein